MLVHKSSGALNNTNNTIFDFENAFVKVQIHIK